MVVVIIGISHWFTPVSFHNTLVEIKNYSFKSPAKEQKYKTEKKCDTLFQEVTERSILGGGE